MPGWMCPRAQRTQQRLMFCGGLRDTPSPGRQTGAGKGNPALFRSLVVALLRGQERTAEGAVADLGSLSPTRMTQPEALKARGNMAGAL